MELSDLKEKYEKTEQEKQSLIEELQECKGNMKELQEKGTKVSAHIIQLSLKRITKKSTIALSCIRSNIFSCLGFLSMSFTVY